MKNSLLFLLIIFQAFNIFSQDMIVKKDGEEIQSKIIEIGIENVKFKKHDNLEGPDYILPKHAIVFVKFENGTKEIFNVAKSGADNSEVFRKGSHMGFHISPAMGKMLNSGLDMAFAYNLGLDLNVYFNDFVGIKTGFDFQNIPLNAEDNMSYYSNGGLVTVRTAGGVKSFGVPLKLVLTTGSKVGLYFEIGLAAKFIIAANIEGTSIDERGLPLSTESIKLTNEPVFLTEESTLGVYWKGNRGTSFNLGVYNQRSLTNVLKGNGSSDVLLLGLQFGVLFYLPN
jgi:hypothetical protein